MERPKTDGVVWRPQRGPQAALIACPCAEILFGGARGGGKTDALLGRLAVREEDYGGALNAVIFRREMPQADDLIERALELYRPLGAEFNKQQREFRFESGARVRFRPLENTADAQKYQGQNISDVGFEEAGNYPDSGPIDALFGAIRSKSGVPVQMILTANPGGAGQSWIKARFIDAAPPMVPFQRMTSGGTLAKHLTVFIPSKVRDNRMLLQNDPGYLDRLQLVGSPELVRAWLDGDWSVVAGAFFPEFGPQHQVRPVSLPAHWTRFRCMDWGSAKPFAVYWVAVSDGELPQFPRGALVVYREWYGASGPNVGLKMTAESVAEGIRDREMGDRITDAVCDPAMWQQDGGPSIAERMQRAAGITWRSADNKRLPGWDQLRSRLIGQDERPMLYVFETCRDLIRTLPAAQHDPSKAEDLDTDAEDHALDALRYGVMSRPWVRTLIVPPKPVYDYEVGPDGVARSGLGFRDIIARKASQRGRD